MKCYLSINANDPKTLLDCTLFGADGLIFDLAAVPVEEKLEAVTLLREALGFFNLQGATPVVKLSADRGRLLSEARRLAGAGAAAFLLDSYDRALVAELVTILRGERLILTLHSSEDSGLVNELQKGYTSLIGICVNADWVADGFRKKEGLGLLVYSTDSGTQELGFKAKSFGADAAIVASGGDVPVIRVI